MVQNPDINANDQKLNANNGFSGTGVRAPARAGGGGGGGGSIARACDRDRARRYHAVAARAHARARPRRVPCVMSRRSSPNTDPPTRAAAAAAAALARSRARACDRSRALWRYATAARTTAARTRTAPRRNVGELLKTQTKTTNFAHARMRHFDKNKQKTKKCRDIGRPQNGV